ncbi:hypothetical protein DPMN_039259 [Dreissena polymorpha]|uniref:Uncharacterized protein n=1 Tax=Dreissena polymorpha TaxID=45954 RepID=A0A9D4DAT4_DREPO|nr:hypothetical protein DPMN_047679 [Dreissena polymorpha]KAH3875980.1 hypothetical protein DPMN_039259 [Dreissena polymorpha]
MVSSTMVCTTGPTTRVTGGNQACTPRYVTWAITCAEFRNLTYKTNSAEHRRRVPTSETQW